MRRIHLKFPQLKLTTIIILFVCSVVLISLLITSLLAGQSTGRTIENSLEEKALTTARAAAETEEIQNGLQDPSAAEAVQQYTSTIQEAVSVYFVVVMDMDGIRISHPDEELIGEAFVGGDESRVLEQGEEYTSRAAGTLGESLRAFTPVFDDDGTQIGAVAVGLSLDTVDAAVAENQYRILTGSLLGLIIGLIGAYVLSRYIRKIMFGMEPHAIARLHEERNHMLQSAHEGITAIDENGRIRLVNRSARELFTQAGLMTEDPEGKRISDVIPGAGLERVLHTGKEEINQEYSFHGLSIIINRIPIIVNGRTVGAIATFRDKTEINSLAEELTGVQMYADSLRSQSHEFMNYLHVLLGMIKMEKYNDAATYISRIVDHQAHEVQNVAYYIKDPVLAGFIIGKASYAREAHVEFQLSFETKIPASADRAVTGELVTILGNLINNAVESVVNLPEKKVHVHFSFVDGLLTVSVTDSGPGIKEEDAEKIFLKKYSTKEGEARGFGLHLVKESIEKLDGSIETSIQDGTEFTVIIPYETGGESYD
jgi:two-component system, CitB family, sensor histidine kinase MalK